jgi:hypothetical protein
VKYPGTYGTLPRLRSRETVAVLKRHVILNLPHATYGMVITAEERMEAKWSVKFRNINVTARKQGAD